MLRILESAKLNTIKTIATYYGNMFSFDCINSADTNGKTWDYFTHILRSIFKIWIKTGTLAIF